MIDSEAKVEIARKLWLEGYNCSQSVVGAFASEMEMTEKQAVKLASGLGGGLGGLRIFCGAMAGAFVVFGQMLGYDDAQDLDRKKWFYSLEQNAAARFTEEFGTLSCRDLLEKAGVLVTSVPAPRTKEYYVNRPCGLFVEKAVRIVCDILNEELG